MDNALGTVDECESLHTVSELNFKKPIYKDVKDFSHLQPRMKCH